MLEEHHLNHFNDDQPDLNTETQHDAGDDATGTNLRIQHLPQERNAVEYDVDKEFLFDNVAIMAVESLGEDSDFVLLVDTLSVLFILSPQEIGEVVWRESVLGGV